MDISIIIDLNEIVKVASRAMGLAAAATVAAAA
jgi:hypothetical protein